MIKVLGAFGAKYLNYYTTCFKIANSIYLDAGNIVGDENLNFQDINIVLSHSHFDHIVDLPFLIDNFYEKLTKPINIYASKETIEDLKRSIFNNKIWPNFFDIPLLNQEKSINLIPINGPFKINNVEFIPFEANHTIRTLGFVINKTYLISSDTYINENLINIANQYKIPNLIIEVSFPNKMDKLAEVSKHLTPKLLDQMLSKLNYTPKNIYVYHIKPTYLDEIKKELKYKILQRGDII